MSLTSELGFDERQYSQVLAAAAQKDHPAGAPGGWPPSAEAPGNVAVVAIPASEATGHPSWDLDRKEAIDEELDKYFKEGQAAAAPGINGGDPNTTVAVVTSADADESTANQLKLSQLRQLLEKNLKSPQTVQSAFKPASATKEWGAPEGVVEAVHHGEPEGFATHPGAIVSSETMQAPTASNATSGGAVTSLSSRRRVSFNPLIVQDPQGGAGGINNGAAGVHHGLHPNGGGPGHHVGHNGHGGNMVNVGGGGNGNQPPPGSSSSGSTGGNGGPLAPGVSPGTRKRHFSFQPISPRQASLPQSPLASPFISPRSTPVHMMRSRHSSGSALPLHMLPGGGGQMGGVHQKGPFGSSGSDISRAATFGSASECSTPFISPHGTPIPFNRSRHNSAQGRLCRSRHSSGVGPYRYSMTPFSPMALSNLNNPYSPQPATPLGSTSGEEPMFNVVGNNGNGFVGADGSNINAVMNVSDGSVQHMMTDEDDRSRHNSADSDPNHVRSAPLSPHHLNNPTSGIGDGLIGGGGGGSHAHLQNQQQQQQQQHQQRLRHASAGNPPNPALATLKPPDWMQDPTLTLAASYNQPGGGGNDLSEAIFDNQRPRSVGPITVQMSSGDDYGGLFSSIETSDSRGNGGGKPGSDTPNPNPAGGSTAGGGQGGAGGNDDLDMALSALKACDTDFSKFVQEVEGDGTTKG